MTNAELKTALLSKCPVEYGGVRYLRVAEIVYRMPGKELIISAGLLDKNENCLVYAPPEKVTVAEQKTQLLENGG